LGLALIFLDAVGLEILTRLNCGLAQVGCNIRLIVRDEGQIFKPSSDF
jgi:hypothetical protein